MQIVIFSSNLLVFKEIRKKIVFNHPYKVEKKIHGIIISYRYCSNILQNIFQIFKLSLNQWS